MSFSRALFRNKTSVVGLVLTLLVIGTAVFSPILAPRDPREQSIRDKNLPPSRTYLLGTDRFGRDVLSRIIVASRASLAVGFGAALFGAVVGTVLGAVATFVGGRTEALMIKVIDVLMSFPTLLLCLLVLIVLGSGLSKVLLAIGIAFLPRFARISRGPTLTLRNIEYVEAARAMGAGNLRIVLRHILPNIVGPIAVMMVLWMASAIRIEATLSFLGFGVQPPSPTWGNMIQDGFRTITYAPRLALFPGIALFVAVLGLNLLGDGMRDALDPKLRGK